MFMCKQNLVGMKSFATFFVKAFLISLFLWIRQNSYTKFRSRRKSSETRIIEVEELQYPSISVCVQNAFKKYVDISQQSKLTFWKTRELVEQNVWKRNETFFFVNHPTVKSKGYPCMTTKESREALQLSFYLYGNQ